MKNSSVFFCSNKIFFVMTQNMSAVVLFFCLEFQTHLASFGISNSTSYINGKFDTINILKFKLITNYCNPNPLQYKIFFKRIFLDLFYLSFNSLTIDYFKSSIVIIK